MSKIVVYISTVASNLDIKKKQQKVEMILESKFKQGGPVTLEYVDVAASEADKKKMRDLSGNPKALPPQFFNGDTYCGDYDAFDEAVESDALLQFLRLA